jgi:CobQ-like glutamine amidotransferase family enzyme
VLGGGEDDAQVSVADDVRLRASIVAATAAGASILAVCGGYQLLGASFLVGDGREVAGFDIFDWRTDRLRRRAVGEVVADSLLPGAAAPLTGFENHGGRTVLGPGVSALGAVRLGVGNGVGDVEGAVQDRMVATYLHGPVLARNPQLADHLLELVVGPLAPLDDPPVDRLREERLAAGHRRGRWPRRRGPAGS